MNSLSTTEDKVGAPENEPFAPESGSTYELNTRDELHTTDESKPVAPASASTDEDEHTSLEEFNPREEVPEAKPLVPEPTTSDESSASDGPTLDGPTLDGLSSPQGEDVNSQLDVGPHHAFGKQTNSSPIYQTKDEIFSNKNISDMGELSGFQFKIRDETLIMDGPEGSAGVEGSSGDEGSDVEGSDGEEELKVTGEVTITKSELDGILSELKELKQVVKTLRKGQLMKGRKKKRGPPTVELDTDEAPLKRRSTKKGKKGKKGSKGKKGKKGSKGTKGRPAKEDKEDNGKKGKKGKKSKKTKSKKGLFESVWS